MESSRSLTRRQPLLRLERLEGTRTRHTDLHSRAVSCVDVLCNRNLFG